MIDPELLEILVCPETHQPLKLAEESQIADLNTRREAGNLVNVGGDKVEEAFEGGLIREDGNILYPIREGIPVMLIDEGIPLEATSAETS